MNLASAIASDSCTLAPPGPKGELFYAGCAVEMDDTIARQQYAYNPLMVTGTCKLCLKEAVLRRSHLVPRAMYKYASDPGPAPNTLVVSRKGRGPVIRQITAPLLCSACEQRFSRMGEDWMMSQVWSAKGFPLLDRLNVSIEMGKTPDSLIYSGSACGIDTDSLGYFALSVLWRAGVHDWHTSKDSTERISLGAYEEPLRQFLAGEAGIPANVSVMASVCTDRYAKYFHIPTVAKFPIPVRAFAFMALGVQFLIFTDQFAPTAFYCIQSPAKLLFKRDCSRKTLEAFADLMNG